MGSKSYARYEKYKDASTYEEFLELGGRPADFKNDMQKGYIVEVKVEADSDYGEGESEDRQ